MTAPVRIDASAWGDLRFATLARLCGFADAEHALIKCARIWAWQTEHYTDDNPTYCVDADLVESALGPDGADHLVRSRLAEDGPSGLRIKGSTGRIEWLWKKRIASRSGGEATKRKHADKEGPTGPVSAQPVARPETGPNPGPLTLPPDHQISDSLTPRAIDTQAYAIARDTWAAVSAARVEIATELKLRNVIAMPARFGMPSEPRGCRELRDRVREEGDNAAATCKHVVENLIAQAREEKTVEWLSEKAFTAGGWQTARNWIAGQPQQRTRAGPRRAGDLIGSASPRSDHAVSTTLIPIREL